MIIYNQKCCKINAFSWPLKKLKKKFLIDFHVKTLECIFWHYRIWKYFLNFPQGVYGCMCVCNNSICASKAQLWRIILQIKCTMAIWKSISSDRIIPVAFNRRNVLFSKASFILQSSNVLLSIDEQIWYLVLPCNVFFDVFGSKLKERWKLNTISLFMVKYIQFRNFNFHIDTLLAPSLIGVPLIFQRKQVQFAQMWIFCGKKMEIYRE